MNYKNIYGYTLIEMLVALSLMVIVLLGGTLLFTQNLRTGGMTEVDLRVNGSARAILDELERTLRFGEVRRVGQLTRDDCLNALDTGVTADSVEVETISGVSTVYSLLNQKIASTSADNVDPFYLGGSDIVVNSLNIGWFCRSGISDKINLEISISSTVLGTGVTITKTVSRDILLLNGSIN
jgi:prepilin-type N-terminal cleavage/methylation domain-containing protein